MKDQIKNKVIKKLLENIRNVAPSTIEQKPKKTVVTFDKSTKPFEVTYSERGFDIGGTRLSFEFIEAAISKDVNIVLDKGKGLVLDSVKMQKILKYKGLY